ncbi:MAG: hypothetical protein ACRYG2_32660 [Janthinobacterium lividum]
MAITWTPSTSEGDWLGASGAPWWQAATFGPAGFEAYARLRFIPDPVRAGTAEADVELPDLHPSDLDQTCAALRVLAPFTGTPHACWFAVWDGWGHGLEIPAGLPLLELPHRRHALLRADLADVQGWQRALGRDSSVVPAFVWPADRRWCLASDVDPHWAGIGAEEAAVRALLAAPGLDVVRADPTEPQPSYH